MRLRLLAALSLLVLVVIQPLLATCASTSSSGVRYYVILLPESQPSDPKVGDAVVDLLALVNRLAWKAKLRAYMLLADVVIEGERAPAGSLVVEAPIPEELLEAVERAKGGAKLVGPVASLPPVPVIAIEPLRIALFDNGALGEISLPEVLEKLGFHYDVLGNDSITRLLPSRYDVLILPPGSGTATALRLGPGGSRIVAEFVRRGGGLVGICAGAYAVVEGYNKPTTWLQLVDARIRNWPVWALGTGLVVVNITSSHPVVYGFKGALEMVYWNGPVLEPHDLGKNTTLGLDVEAPRPLAVFVGPVAREGAFSPGWGNLNASYVEKVMRGGYAVTVSYYGLGRIVLFSVHPELLSGHTSYAPASKLPGRYNWRMLWNALYYAGGRRAVLGGAIVGTWMKPSMLRKAYEALLAEKYGKTAKLTAEEKLEVLREALDYLARELASHGVTDVFLEVKLLSGKLIYPSRVAEKYGVQTIAGKSGIEPYNLTNIVREFAEALHRHGVRLHAWLIVWYDKTWGARDPMWHCGKWLSKDKMKPPYKVTSRVRLFNEEYRRYLADLARELVLDCGVDGIHLDYIRWPHMVYSFGPKDYELASRYGINLTKVRELVLLTFYGDPSRGIPPQPDLVFRKYAEGDQDVVKWFELRRKAVVAIVEAVKKAAMEAAREANRQVILSAAVMPEEPLETVKLCRKDLVTGKTICAEVPGRLWQWLHYGQRYRDFLERGYWVIPMAYHRAWHKPPAWTGEVAAYVRSLVEEVNPSLPVLIGVQCYNVEGIEEVRAAVGYALEGGASGWVYYYWGVYRNLAWTGAPAWAVEELEAGKRLVAGPARLAATLVGDREAVQALERLYSELAVAGKEYYKPDLLKLAESLEDELRPLLVRLVDLLNTKLIGLTAVATGLPEAYKDYYKFLAEEARKQLEEIRRAPTLAEMVEPVEKLVEKTAASILLIELAIGEAKLKKKLDTVEAGLAKTYTELREELKTRLGNTENRLARMVTEASTKLGQSLNKLRGEVEKKLEATKAGLKELEAKLEELGKKHQKLGEKAEKLEARLPRLEGEVAQAQQVALIALALAVIAMAIAVIQLLRARR